MLLSEVLHIAKNINKPLNESLKSSILTDIFKPFNRSNLFLKPVIIDSKKYNGHDAAGLDMYDIEWMYEKALRRKILSPDDYTTHEGREKFTNIKYVKKKKNTTSYILHDDGSFINRIMDLIYLTCQKHIGLSEISDDNIVKIPYENAKKKEYKTGLLFWCDYNGILKAVTLNGTIICYIEESNSPWYESNPNYNEEVPLTTFDNESTILEWVKEAFIPIKRYNIYTSKSDIKNLIGSVSIKSLLSVPSMMYVYAVNAKELDDVDTTEKLQSRKEYAMFILKMYNMASDNRERYRRELTVRRQQNNDTIVYDNVMEFLDTCFNTYKNLLDYELNYLQEDKNPKLKTYHMITFSHWRLMNNIRSNISIRCHYINNIKKTGAEYVCPHTIGDIFIIINTYIQTCIELANETMKSYILLQDKKSKGADKEEILNKLRNLKSNYNDLVSFILSDPIKIQSKYNDMSRIINEYLDSTLVYTNLNNIGSFNFKKVN